MRVCRLKAATWRRGLLVNPVAQAKTFRVALSLSCWNAEEEMSLGVGTPLYLCPELEHDNDGFAAGYSFEILPGKFCLELSSGQNAGMST